MVLGTPTTFTPCSESLPATPSVSSPPMAIRASTPRLARLAVIRSRPVLPSSVAFSESGLVRDEPSIVPPRGKMPRTAGTSSVCVSASSGPRQPSRKPTNSHSWSKVPVLTIARMTAFRPGQSPPPVRTPTRISAPSAVCSPARASPATLVPMSVLAIDAGTTGVTALIVTADGGVAARGYAEFSQYFPEPGWVEQRPEEIWQATLTACAQALGAAAGPDPVSCIGITNQRETAVVWDSATLTSPHRAIVWQDRRTAGICAELREAGHEERVTEITGLRLDPYFVKPTVLECSDPADEVFTTEYFGPILAVHVFDDANY